MTPMLIAVALAAAAMLPAAPAAEATRDVPARAERHPPSLEGARFAPVATGASATLR
jgi:hypothetical protein